jgi:two-component system, LytTR family, response regulator
MRALLVDDEELALDRMARLLAEVGGLEIVGRARSGPEAMALVAAVHPEVVFLDVEMPGASGLDVVRSLPAPRPRIVFCTGYDHYAVQAFELSAIDYLLKPVTRERLAVTLERLRKDAGVDRESAVDRATRNPGEARLLVRAGGTYRVVAPGEIECFASEDGVTFLLTEGERLVVSLTLDELERRLDPVAFFRISRAALVRLERVVEVAPDGGQGLARMRSGMRLRVSRRRFQDLLERLQGRVPPG